MKSQEDFQKILNKTFQEKSKIKNSVYFFRVPRTSPEYGDANSMFFATRYDYLRIAKAMLDDWQNDTCAGKYLKTIYKKRIPKNDKYTDDKGSFFYSKGYAGQFYTDFPKLKDRAVMAMEGASGQSIIIDFDKGKINVINSIHTNYDWKKIAISKFN